MKAISAVCAWVDYWHLAPQSHDRVCDLPAVQRTLCSKHYHRLEYHGLKGCLPTPYTNGVCGLFFCETPTFNGDFCRRHGFFREYGIHSSVVNHKIVEQSGRCGICRDPLDFKTKFGWALDHSHLCGLHDPLKACSLCVRGVLCPTCNKGIGLLGDRSERLYAHIAYLGLYIYDPSLRDDSPASAHDRSKNPDQICIEMDCQDNIRARRLCAHHIYTHQRDGDLHLYPTKGKSSKRNNYLWSKHLLPEDEYIAAATEQNNRCANRDCLTSVPGGPGEWHIDHDHRCAHTGMRISCVACRRGLLCSNCNTGAGCFNDDPSLLASAARYLEKWACVEAIEVAA